MVCKYLVPYVFFEFIIGGVVYLFRIIVCGDSPLMLFLKVIREIALLIGSDSVMMGALWFLGVLGISLALSNAIIAKRPLEDKWHLYEIFVLALLTFFAILAEQIEIMLPLRIKSIPAITSIILCGKFYHRYIEKIVSHLNIFTFSIVVIIMMLLAVYNRTVNVSIPVYNNYVLFLVCALLGIMSVYYISAKLGNGVISFLGRNSLIIFAIHGIWLQVYSYLISIICNQPILYMRNMPIWACMIGGLFVLMASVLSYYLIKGTYNKYTTFCRKILKY